MVNQLLTMTQMLTTTMPGPQQVQPGIEDQDD